MTRCSPVRHWRSTSTPASSLGSTSTRRARRWISTTCSNACWSTTTTRICCSRVGKDGILWKLDRKTGKYLGHKEMVFQNVYESFDPQDRASRHYRNDIVEQNVGEWVPGLPDHRGRQELAGDASYHQPTNRLIIPLSQSCLEMSAQTVEKKEGGGSGDGARRRFFEMPGIERQRRQARRLRCADHARDLEVRAARAVPDRRDFDGGRRRVRGRPRPHVPRVRRRTPARFSGRRGSAPSVQGFPLTFSVDGKQYIGITTGNGGGSPRHVPATIAPDLHPPATGNALYVFALPDKR